MRIETLTPLKSIKIQAQLVDTKQQRIAADSGATTRALAGLIGKRRCCINQFIAWPIYQRVKWHRLKAAGKHLLANTVEEAVDEGLAAIGANIGASNTYEPSRDLTQGGKSAVQGRYWVGMGFCACWG